MAIAKGNYVMLNVAKTTLAMDVAGATGTKGQNIQLHNVNYSDAQIVTVVPYKDSTTDQVLRFPLTWQCVDVPKGVGHGSNVWQWPWSDSINQRWRITQDGSRTIVVDGTRYPVYKVAMAANTAYVLATNTEPSTVKSGTNVCIDRDAADGGNKDDRRWVFVPINTLPNGVYRFMPENTHSVSAGITGKAGDTQVYMHANADTNNQRWVVTNDGNTGRVYIVNKGTGQRAAASGTESSNVILKKAATEAAQQWVANASGEGTYNGQIFPLVYFRCVAGINQVWDAQGGVPTTKVNSKLIAHTYNGGENQQWLAVPESWLDSSIPAPSDCGVAYSEGSTKYLNLWARAKQNFVPTFKSTGKNFQMRYRKRVRKATAGDTEFGGWSAWMSISNNTQAYDGWANESSPNCAVTPSGGRYYAKSIPITVSPTDDDCVEVQYQVREWRKQGPRDIAHGNVSTFTGRVKWKPQLTVTDIKWGPQGFVIYYRSDQKRNNNDFNVYNVAITDVNTGKRVTLFDGDYLLNDVRWSGSMVIPSSKIPYIPNVGDTISITGRWTNVDGAYNKAKETFTDTITYDTGRESGLFTSTSSVNSQKMLVADCNLADADTYELYLDYNSDKTNLHKFVSEDGAWTVPPAFNKQFTIYIVAKKGNKWDIESKSFSAIVPRPKTFLFNYQKNDGTWGYFQLFADEGKSASIQRQVENDYRADLTMGEFREVVHYGYGHREGGTVTGTHYKDSKKFPSGNIWPMDNGQSRYCYLRPANSEVYRVAITDFTISNERFDRTTYTVNFRTLDSISTS